PRDLREVEALELATLAGGDEDLVEADTALRDRAPPFAVDQALLDDAAPRRAVGQALEQLADAAVVRPGRHHVVELGAAGVVGIDIAEHVHAPGPRGLEQAQRGVDLRPVLLARGLDVRDLHADAAFLADADRLVDRVEKHRGLAADVREVVAAARGY